MHSSYLSLEQFLDELIGLYLIRAGVFFNAFFWWAWGRGRRHLTESSGPGSLFPAKSYITLGAGAGACLCKSKEKLTSVWVS